MTFSFVWSSKEFCFGTLFHVLLELSSMSLLLSVQPHIG